MRQPQLPGLFITITLLLMTAIPAAAELPPFDPNTVPEELDYSRSESWVALPADTDQYPVDIFWVYPTILFGDAGWLMDNTNTQLQAAAKGTLIKQASVFSGQANLYAPFYRQMNMAALSLSEAERNTIIEYGYEDVKKALNYYLKHHNKGRPFILAGHSQGSNILTDIAIEEWGSLGVEKQLVAAYLIGWSITPANLKENPALAICAAPDQTGCFITYNTVAAGRQKSAPTIIEGTIVVNPLSWTITDEIVPANMNIGAVFFEGYKPTQPIPQFTSAQAKDSGLVVVPADPRLVADGPANFPKGVYHMYDYSLFYENLMENVARRIKAHNAQ